MQEQQLRDVDKSHSKNYVIADDNQVFFSGLYDAKLVRKRKRLEIANQRLATFLWQP